ncbi:MAG: hypothetical protein KDE03_13460 [Rhodobacteraceae bacterium]|nr:hypothetical protein [Paracoccaceae bacterium]
MARLTVAVAKRHGGWFSSFRGRGAIPGYQFKSEEARKAFLEDVRKPTIGFEQPAGYDSVEGFEESETAFDPYEPVPRDVIRAMMPELRAELDRLDLKRVRLFHDENNILDLPDGTQGMFMRNPSGSMAIVIAQSLNPTKTLYHEVIHALRSMEIFTPQEWRALELMAERKWLDEFDILDRYPHLTTSEQIEEAIAEAFADATNAKKSPSQSIIAQAFNKILRLLRAIRNAFNGAGFNTVEDVFGRIIAGEMTRRNVGNTGAAFAMQEDKRQALPEDIRLWRDALARFLRGKIPSSADLRVGRVPLVLRALGVPNGAMVMRASKARLVVKTHGDLPLAALSDLPNLIADPEMVFAEKGKESDALVLTTAKTDDGRPVVVAIKVEGETNKGQRATVVMTVYPLDDAKTKVQHYARNGRVLYLADERSVAEYELTGDNSLRGPKGGLSANAAPKKILRRTDVFKGDAKMQAARVTNTLLAEVAGSSDRLVIIEDTRELQCTAPDLVALRTKDGVASLYSADIVLVFTRRGASFL